MYFVILGAGEVGVRIAQILSNEGHEVVLLERERSRVANIYNRIDCRLIVDEGMKADVLKDAGIYRADYFIAATDSDETNFIVCLLVNKIAPKVRNIARLRERTYLSQSNKMIFPINYIVNPEKEAALSIIRSIEFGGGASDAFTFKNFGDIMMRNYFVDSDSKFVGESLRDVFAVLKIPSSLLNNFLIALINRKEEAIIPTGEVVFQEGDEIFFVGSQAILEDLFTHLGKKIKAAKNIKKIIILGASPVAEQIVTTYYDTKTNNILSILGKKRFASREITIIEQDIKKCEDFADRFPDVTVLHADVTQEDILEDLEISQVDMLIATSGLQEQNIVLAAHSRNLGVPNTIALVTNPVYFNIAAELGISMSLSVRSAVVSSIINFLRGETTLYSLVEGSYGIFECNVDPNSSIVYKSIMSVSLPAKSLILCSSNPKGNFIAYGNFVIQPNDRLLCIAHPDSIKRLRTLFSASSKGEEDSSALDSNQ